MQSSRLRQRSELLVAAPLWREMSAADGDALQERLLNAETVAELAPADQAVLRAAAMQVADGLSPTLQSPEDWGDWAAIDAGVEAEDTDGGVALEVALDTVGRGYGVALPLDDDPVVEDQAKGFDFADDGLAPDDEGWVGV